MVRVLSVGSALQDVYLRDKDDFSSININSRSLFDKLELGAKVDIDKVDFSTGGGATNASVTFARQGLESVFLGTIGHDPAGQAILDKLDLEGVATGCVKYSKKLGTGYSVILLAPNGERTVLTYRGASNKFDLLSADDIDEVKPEWVYLSTLSGDFETLTKLLVRCKKLGAKVMLNPGKLELGKPKKLIGLFEDVDVLLLNKEEAQMLVPGDLIDELLVRILNLVDCAIISDGPNGVIASDGKTKVRAGMYEDVRVVDRTGAGDAFGSGFLSQWCQGKSLKDSIIFASANSTSVVAKIGAKTGILSKGAKLHDMPLDEKKV